MESPRLPSSDAIAAKYSELEAMNDTELRRLRWHPSRQAERRPAGRKAFRTVLDNGAYPGTLKRDDAIAELMKLYMRRQLETVPAAVARNELKSCRDGKGNPEMRVPFPIPDAPLFPSQNG